MKTAIRWALSAACFPILLVGCGREDRVLAPQVRPLASAAALTSALEDPVEDAVDFGAAITAQPHHDIVRAEITKQGGRFIFTMEMAGPIPEAPELAPGTKLLDWSWGLDTDPATSPGGFPFPPGVPRRTEYIVQILWDGTNFIGQLIDRTRLLTGGEAVVIELSFSIRGAALTTSVNADTIGNPESFDWVSIVRFWDTELGSSFAEKVLDGAPDVGFAPWPG